MILPTTLPCTAVSAFSSQPLCYFLGCYPSSVHCTHHSTSRSHCFLIFLVFSFLPLFCARPWGVWFCWGLTCLCLRALSFSAKLFSGPSAFVPLHDTTFTLFAQASHPPPSLGSDALSQESRSLFCFQGVRAPAAIILLVKQVCLHHVTWRCPCRYSDAPPSPLLQLCGQPLQLSPLRPTCPSPAHPCRCWIPLLPVASSPNPRWPRPLLVPHN